VQTAAHSPTSPRPGGELVTARARVLRYFEVAAQLALHPDSPGRYWSATTGEAMCAAEVVWHAGVAGLYTSRRARRAAGRAFGGRSRWPRCTRPGPGAEVAVCRPPRRWAVYRKLGFQTCGRFTEYAVVP